MGGFAMNKTEGIDLEQLATEQAKRAVLTLSDRASITLDVNAVTLLRSRPAEQRAQLLLDSLVLLMFSGKTPCVRQHAYFTLIKLQCYANSFNKQQAA